MCITLLQKNKLKKTKKQTNYEKMYKLCDWNWAFDDEKYSFRGMETHYQHFNKFVTYSASV